MLRQWDDIKQALNPYWSGTTTTSGDQATEVQFLKNFTWTAEVSDDPESNRNKNSAYVTPCVSSVQVQK